MTGPQPAPAVSQLQHFVALAEELHFTRAARRVSLGQQGLSSSIRSLERTLGVRLFSRSTRRVELTAAGVAFLDPARRTLAELDAGLRVVRGIVAGQIGEIRLAATVSGDFDVLSRALAALQSTRPAVRVSVTRGTSAANVGELRAGRIDAALVRTPLANPAGLRLLSLQVDSLVAVVVSDDPLADVSAVTPADLADRQVVLFPRAASPGLFDHLAAWVGAAAVRTGAVLERPDEEMIIREVAAGGGVGFTTATRAAEIAAAGVRWRPLRPPLTTELAAAHREGDESPLLAPFVDSLLLAARATRHAIDKPQW